MTEQATLNQNVSENDVNLWKSAKLEKILIDDHGLKRGFL